MANISKLLAAESPVMISYNGMQQDNINELAAAAAKIRMIQP